MSISSPRAARRVFFTLAPLLIVLALIFASALQSGSAVTRNFTVKHFTPEGLVQGPAEIRIEFSSDTALSGDLDRILEARELPIDISPPLQGRGKWLNASTFVYQPQGGVLPQATRYSVSVREKLSDLSGNKLMGKRVFVMHTAPLIFKGVRQVDFDTNSDFVTYELSFSLPVKTSRLMGFLSVLDHKGKKVSFVTDGELLSDRIAIRVKGQDGSPITIGVEKGMTAEQGPLGIEKTTSFKTDRNMSLVVRRAEPVSDIMGSFIEVETSAPLDVSKAASFIGISGSERVLVEAAWGNITRLRGSFKPRDRVTVTLRKGLPSVSGQVLEKEWERAFIIRDMEPDVNFTAQGRFLSPAGKQLLLPLQSVNIEKLNVRLSRVYDNNVSVVMAGDWPYYPESLSEVVYKEDFLVGGDVNKPTSRAIDMQRALAGRKGLFMVQAQQVEGWRQTSTVINVTDIAGSMRLGPDSALVWAASISNGKPLKNVSVTIWSQSNQPLATGQTNADGIWSYAAKEPWGASLRPDFATLSLGDDTAVLRLDQDLWARSGLDISGPPYPGKGYQAFCYTPRGVFRPGEKVPVQVLLRDENLFLKEPFPIQVKVFTPAGREWRTYTPMLSAMGMASVLVQLSDAAPTGTWTADVRIPGDTRSLGRARFAVEDFAPPRISVKAKANKKELFPDDSANVSIEAKYLFGSPADDLAYEAEMTFIPRKYSHKDWPNYLFEDERLEFEAESVSIGNGNLSATGEAELSFRVRAMKPPSVLDAVIRVGVMEDSGRWVYGATTIPYYPHPILLGIQRPDGNLTTGSKLPFRVAAITPDGKPASTKKVQVRTFKLVYQPQVSRVSERVFSEMRTEHILIEEKEITLANGVANAEVTLQSGGEYLFVVEDPATKAAASRSFNVYDSSWQMADGQATLPERLTVTLDKELYKPGESVKARVHGTFGGTVLLTVETDRVVYSASGASEKGSAEFSFKVTEAMSPNAWVTAQLVRPAIAEKEWTAHRASGVAPLSVDCSPQSLSVTLKSPAQLKPRAKNDFSLQLTDASGKGVAGEVSLMLVDDGVLALTRYTSPNPFSHFTARRGLGMSAYDIYDQLLPLYARPPKLLSPGGGEGENLADASLAKGAFSPVRADRFKILTLYKRVNTDANGKADFSFVLPEFSGRARLMAVAASKTAFGAVEESFVVTREIVAELSVPRAVSPEDVFSAQIQFFNQTAVPQDVRYELAATGPLSAKDAKGSVKLASGDAGVAFVPIEMRATSDSGVAEILLTTHYAGKTSVQKIELPVRPPYPRISKTGSFVLEPGKSQTLSIPGGWMQGTRRGVLTAAGLPMAQFADLARFLVDYPYHCLEQTVSSGWALLAQPDLVRNIDESLATPRQISESLAERLRRIQALQRRDGAFASWPGFYAEGSNSLTDWNSVYTAHFLSACEAAGVRIPGDTLRLARNYLRDLIAVSPNESDSKLFAAALDVRAYACYVLALGKDVPPLAWMSYLKDNLKEMTSSGRLILAAAYARAGEKSYARSLLSESAPATGTYKPSTREGRNLDSNLRTRALSLMAWNEIDPSSAGAAGAALDILTALRATEQVTTQEASFALATLGHYYSFNQEKGKAKFISTLHALVPPGESSAPASVQIPEKLDSVKLTNEGDGRGFVSWSVDGVPLKAPAAEDLGIRVRVRLTDSSGKDLKQGVPLVRGAKLVGTITLESIGAPASNLVVSLPLAGGLEIENPRLINPADDPSRVERQTGVRQELRDDRLLLFLDELEKPFTWKFTMRAVTPGTFTLPPISAEGMYSPGVRSITRAGTIKIVRAGE